jgi:hypothetical protein
LRGMFRMLLRLKGLLLLLCSVFGARGSREPRGNLSGSGEGCEIGNGGAERDLRLVVFLFRYLWLETMRGVWTGYGCLPAEVRGTPSCTYGISPGKDSINGIGLQNIPVGRSRALVRS